MKRTIDTSVYHAIVVAAFVIVVGSILLTASLPYLGFQDPVTPNYLAARQAPSLEHFLGTDELGRDVLARLAWGIRPAVLASVFPVALAVLISVPIGLLAGYRGGLIDGIIMRLADAMLAVPLLVLALALVAVAGAGLQNAILAICVGNIPIFVRLVRAGTLEIQHKPFIEAALSGGLSPARIMYLHILPNIMAPVLVQSSLSIATAILIEAGLAYLGLSQPPPAPSWGGMLADAQRYLSTDPLMAVWPGLAIFLLVFAINIVGDVMKLKFDPREH